ncbi:hypothetical protein [Streptomyces rishiriensis]|uniref:Pimeloyl-ACP methyl ester carboxylesterase n=1 Tax=Streptomyces rishiriensis TaxID=68264 RepID=A0ABU0P124_STRRH|nr:hypothetical protein [Streptomyces rishiriensis]MDQ0584713.1 pimeloyl-ACP methyl ester carboxylesterase [Streptomyces rishiriensis]
MVRGDRGGTGLRSGERQGLSAFPHLRTVTVPDAGHLLLVAQPASVAAVVAEAVRASVR